MNHKEATVLILDDDDGQRFSFSDYFEDLGYMTLSANSGASALALLDHHSPDAAIVDIRMQGMSGEEFIRHAAARLPQCIFIICTGSPGYEVPETFKGLPRLSTNIFSKPIADLSLVRNEIERMLNMIRAVSDEYV